MTATVFIAVVFVFFFIIGLLYLLGWKYNPDSNILGGVVLMMLVLIVLIVLFLLAARDRRNESQNTAEIPGSLSLLSD